jgi:dipeptidyl aminopeptidase/acylaminoacyl peptidase
MRVLTLLLLLSTVCPAQIEKNLDALYSVVHYTQSAVSPDGKKLAWVESIPGKASGDSRNSIIRLRDLSRESAPGRITARRITAGDGKKTCAESALAWSPDSKRMVFFSNCADSKQRELYIVSADGGSPRKLTSLSGFLANPRWSPDGKQIAILFTENAVRNAGPTEPTAVETGVISEKSYEQRLTLIDPESGKAKQISPTDTYVYEYDWSPDGSEFAYTAAKGSGDNNWWIAQLFRMPAAGGEPKLVLKPAAQIAVPRWSPDGKSIAYIGGIMSDEGSTGGDVFVVPADGGAAKNITPNRKSSPAYLVWMPGANNQLLITEHVDGGSAITTLNTETGATETLWKADETIRATSEALSVSLSKDAKTASVIRTSWVSPPEVWAGPIGDWKPVTHANDAAKPEWGKAEKLHWVSEGARVQGWLLYPKNFDAAKKYPMVVSVHGGPASQRSPSWPMPGFDLSLLAGEGYFVFFPNPRGSYGGGESFTQGNVKDFGYGDLRDVMAGVDQVLKTVPVDESRLGIGGWSYGGYMTMWTVTQTHRFKAAVAGAGVVNWQSYYGQNAIDEWMIPYFGASVYDDPSVYAKSSPITFIKNVKTPTLVVVGERDAECPAPQSYEFWHALKTLGVKTELVVYPGEGHGFQDPKHREDVLKRSVEWFNANLK